MKIKRPGLFMMLIVAMFALFLGITPANAWTDVWHSAQPSNMAELKTYEATIKQGEKPPFTDTCQASSVSAATRIFEGRYPNASVYGVKEVD